MGAAILAFDIGGTRIKAGLVRDGAVSAFAVAPTNGGQDLIATVGTMGRRLMAGADVIGVGVSIRGIVDPERGILLEVNEVLSAWRGQAIGETVRRELGLPVWVENDARMYALGEFMHGAGAGSQNMVCVTLGTGIGSGVVVDGRVLRGPNGMLGILGGHFTIKVDGPACTCGNIGCLEALIGTAGLLRHTRDVLAKRGDSVLAASSLEPRQVFTAAAGGDGAAREIVRYFAACLGAGVVSLIHAYDPQIVVLGGGLIGASDQFQCPVREYVRTHAWTLPRGRVPVVLSALGDAAALIGVAEFAQGRARFA